MRLDDLGERICIIGQSGAGKSTLAWAIGRAQDLPVVHLDQYRHRPGTDWDVRPDEEFMSLHDAAIERPRWVMDGNYSFLLPDRLGRATGLILMELSTPHSLWRYVARTRGRGERHGGLEGTTDRLSWSMISFLLRKSRGNRARRRRFYDEFSSAKLVLSGPHAVRDFYDREGLTLAPRAAE